VAICDPLPSSRGRRPWRSATHFRHREAAGRGDLSLPQLGRGLPRFARNDGMCARNDEMCARSDGVRARNNRAFGQPAHLRHREAAGRSDLSPISVIARPQAVAICDPSLSSRGRRLWQSATHLCHREAAGRGDLSVTARWRGLPRFARNDGVRSQ
jgi:hypothetical protein